MLEFHEKCVDFFKAFKKALALEDKMLKAARGKTKNLSVSLVEIEQNNLQHILEKTENPDLTSPAYLEKILDYLKRCEEVLRRKQQTMQLNAAFVPIPIHQKLNQEYSQLLQQLQEILLLSPVQKDAKKSWLDTRLRAGFYYRRLTIDHVGLKNAANKAHAEEDLQALQLELQQKASYPVPTKTTQRLLEDEKHNRNFPNDFYPALFAFRKTSSEKITADALEKILQQPAPSV
ncbi:MAG TPA: hypothetical protein VFP93_00080 [Gammaproteobacteria bacterium]|nr:hypothetical protein [Gammaproteobacteria bacterium]